MVWVSVKGRKKRQRLCKPPTHAEPQLACADFVRRLHTAQMVIASVGSVILGVLIGAMVTAYLMYTIGPSVISEETPAESVLFAGSASNAGAYVSSGCRP